MSAASLHSDTHVLDLASVGDSLLSSATRYTRGLGELQTAFSDVNGNGARDPSSAAVVLVLLHGLGFSRWHSAVANATTNVPRRQGDMGADDLASFRAGAQVAPTTQRRANAHRSLGDRLS